jgi:hypothetical protein
MKNFSTFAKTLGKSFRDIPIRNGFEPLTQGFLVGQSQPKVWLFC